ncbi:hypothetical protein pipiens_002286 [Culex pipiens pipiens]|uniref:Endonuclease/exonuclease/phosphatase domain-containing protein n=1 Tax=Culex pipiens pipiens TaxID=38569 RepID=A0ABD1DH39_CULPP
MAPSCKKCEAEITGIERIACRCCKSDFHRSCISGLNRPTFDAIVKNTSNLFWLCDNCNGRFDNLLQAMETDEVTAPAGESAKLVEVVDKLSGIVSELSKRLDNRPKSSYAGIVGSGSQSYEPGSKRLREDEQYEQHQPPREKVKTVCGTRTVQREIKTVVDEREQFWMYLGRLHHSHSVDDIAEMTQECLGLEVAPKVIRLVKKDVDVTKLPFVSFRVLLPDETRDVALQAETWPTGVAIREFDFDQLEPSYSSATNLIHETMSSHRADGAETSRRTPPHFHQDPANLRDNPSGSRMPHTMTPGRTLQSNEECPRPPYTVEPPNCSSIGLRTSQQRRPGPVNGHGSGDFRPQLSGEYSSASSCGPALNLNQLQQNVSVGNRTRSSSFATVYYQNAGGMRSKSKQFFLALASSDYDVIALTETWLSDDIVDAELSPNYTIFRQDRSARTSDRRRGGGVLIAVRNSPVHACTRVVSEGYEHLEQVAVRVKVHNHHILVCCIYIRPNSDPDIYVSHGAAVQELLDLSTHDDSVIVTGDYNLPHLSWYFDDDLNCLIPLNASSEQELALTENVISTGLQQVCSLTNVNGRTLDLAFVNDVNSVELIEPPTPILKTDRHHKAFVLKAVFYAGASESSPLPGFEPDFSNCDYVRVSEALNSVDWDTLLRDQDTNGEFLVLALESFLGGLPTFDTVGTYCGKLGKGYFEPVRPKITQLWKHWKPSTKHYKICGTESI